MRSSGSARRVAASRLRSATLGRATASLLLAATVGAGCKEGTPPAPAGRASASSVAIRSPRAASAAYAGSAACAACHKPVYDRWKTTPMANVVRDPREHPEAILPPTTANPFAQFSAADVALVYGSVWKQRYLTRSGDDYFVQPAQWDITHKTWKKYFAENTGDWWAVLFPPDNKLRPTGQLCDGCHSVGYDIATKKVAEWNVGCERCHGPGSEHAKDPSAVGMWNPAHESANDGTDVCVQCHSQGRPPDNPIGGKYYDWPVGYDVGGRLADHWTLEDHRLGEPSFTHFADGTAHKNRMQGNDYVGSVMYTRGVTCFDCHDPHGTPYPSQLRRPANELCLGCHAPGSHNGPFAPTLEAHTHHAKGSPGAECVACHMPRIEVTIGDVNVHAHTFKIVTPAMTDRYKVPNPCNGCHTDKSTSWAEAAMLRWASVSPWRVR